MSILAKESLQTLEWYQQMGVDEIVEDYPVNHLQQKEKTVAAVKQQSNPKTTTPLQSPDTKRLETRQIAEQCQTREELEKQVRQFTGLAITKTASNTVFCDGNPQAEVMMIGEAPGAEEDAKGVPFCGASGQMLDQMLGYIGLIREKNFYITNTIFWRPPGNRKPTPEELAICEPFVQKHIALMQPKLIILIGGTAVTGVLGNKQGITRLRGKFFDYSNPYLEQSIKTAAIFHPSYLLRSPGQKRYAWQDLLTIKHYIEEQKIKL